MMEDELEHDGRVSAETENLDNSHDENMYQVLNRFVVVPEQSYEEFLNSFTHLSKDNTDNLTKSGQDVQAAWKSNSYSSQTKLISTECSKIQHMTELHLEDDIEEEILEESPILGTMSATCSQGRNFLVKFDNFVDADDTEVNDSEECEHELNDLLGSSGYSASFQGDERREITSSVVERDEPQPAVSDNHDTEEFMTETNFGEVEEEDVARPIENHTCLTIKTIALDQDLIGATTRTTSDDRSTNEVNSSEVESFHLDPDFDYDIVQLTPKYSEEDTKSIMASFKSE